MEISIEFQKQLIETLAAFNQNKLWIDSPFAIGLLTLASAMLAAWFQRWLDYKMQERKSDSEKQLRLHSLQLDALKSLSHAAHDVTPRIEPFQGADNFEWLQQVVNQLSSIADRLDRFLKEHGHVTPPGVCKHVECAINLANNHKWRAIEANSPDFEPNKSELDAVGELIVELDEAVNAFKRKLGVSDVYQAGQPDHKKSLRHRRTKPAL